jgi:hypothetical protein
MLVEIISKRGDKKKSFKKGKFAIQVSDQGRTKYYIRKLKYFLKEKHPSLKEECPLYREKALKAAKDGDYIVFGIGRNYDYQVMSSMSFLEESRIGKKFTVIDLETGYKTVKDAVKRYVLKNSPEYALFKGKSKKSQQCYVPVVERTPVVECPLRKVRPATVCTVKPVTCVAAPRPRKREWDMQVNGRYVLLTNGSRYETRPIHKIGCRETVNIDGACYTIRRDSYGQGIVVV